MVALTRIRISPMVEDVPRTDDQLICFNPYTFNVAHGNEKFVIRNITTKNTIESSYETLQYISFLRPRLPCTQWFSELLHAQYIQDPIILISTKYTWKESGTKV